jgi:hypothetical protein
MSLVSSDDPALAHVGIVADDLGVALGFFVELGLKRQDKASVAGVGWTARETETAERSADLTEISATDDKNPGTASGLTCPECHGSIWELRDGESVRFECRVGHAYGVDAFLEHQGERVEAALWTAVNTLEEGASTCCRLAVLPAGSTRLARGYEEGAAQNAEPGAGVARPAVLTVAGQRRRARPRHLGGWRCWSGPT